MLLLPAEPFTSMRTSVRGLVPLLDLKGLSWLYTQKLRTPSL